MRDADRDDRAAASSAEWWSLERLLVEFQPAPRRDDWTWKDEHDDLWFHPSKAARTRAIAESIQDSGQHEPVTLGNDGRVWDGHHRVVVAMHLGISQVLVEMVGPSWRGPSAWANDACGVCGAMIVYDGRRLHEQWHAMLAHSLISETVELVNVNAEVLDPKRWQQ